MLKKYLLPIIASFFIVGAAYAYKPATLFIETWGGLKKQVVYTEEEANKLFSDGWLLYQGDMLGSTITTINGSDTLKDSRTVINDNFTALNNGKIETSTTTLPLLTTLANLSTVGTIGAGTWNGTAIGVAYGGTGLSTLSGGGRLLYSLNPTTIAALATTTGGVLNIGSTGYPEWRKNCRSFSWPGGARVATTTTATTSIALGVAAYAETWAESYCWCGSGVVYYSYNDGTNQMDYTRASSTPSNAALTANNTFTAGEKRFVDIGTTTVSYLSCTVCSY